MSDRDENRERSEQADAGRKGFGDDQGTRIGAPTPGGERDRAPKPDHLNTSFRVSGVEGDVGHAGHVGDEGNEGDAETGIGAEAAEGMHASRERGPRHEKAAGDVDTGRSRHDEATVDPDPAGSEPLGREREHKSGYGGDGGTPKTSSDQREPLEPEGRADAS